MCHIMHVPYHMNSSDRSLRRRLLLQSAEKEAGAGEGRQPPLQERLQRPLPQVSDVRKTWRLYMLCLPQVRSTPAVLGG